jgi:hypothetical protein
VQKLYYIFHNKSKNVWVGQKSTTKQCVGWDRTTASRGLVDRELAETNKNYQQEEDGSEGLQRQYKKRCNHGPCVRPNALENSITKELKK